MNMEIVKIKVLENRRKISQDKAKTLSESIANIGLLNPVTVTPDNVLVAGSHRLEACKLLGWTEISVNVVELKGPWARLAEIDENLIRNNGTALDQADWLSERKGIWEELYPETKANVAGGKAGGRGREKIASADSASAIPTFTADTAAKTGKSQRVIQESIQIANNLTEEAKEAVRDCDPAANKTDLLELSKMEPGKQLEVIEKMTSGEAVTIKDAIKPPRAKGTGENEWYTPAEIIEAARDVMDKIDLDPASCEEANKTVKADVFFSKENDGLSKDWKGNIWLNPPYSTDLMRIFVEKLRAEFANGNTKSAIMVSHNNTETRWFQAIGKDSSAICFPSTRIRFYRDTEIASPTNGQAFFYLGRDVSRFVDVFSKFGMITAPIHG